MKKKSAIKLNRYWEDKGNGLYMMKDKVWEALTEFQLLGLKPKSSKAKKAD